MSLFKTIDEFARYYPMLQSSSIEHLTPFIDGVEAELMRDQVLGKALYDALHASYQASIADTPTEMSAPMAALLEKVRYPLAFRTAYDSTAITNVSNTTGGMTVSETNNDKPAHMWRVRDAQNRQLKQAHLFLNQLIGFLLANADDYPEWVGSPVQVEVTESLIPTMTEANRYIKLAGAWLLHNIRPSLRGVQNGTVKALLGATALEELVTAVQAGTLTSTQKAWLEEIRPAMLHLAIAENAVPMALQIDEDGLWNWQSVSSGSAVNGGKQPISDQRLTALVRHHESKGKGHLEELRKLVQPEQPSKGFDSVRGGGVWFGGA